MASERIGRLSLVLAAILAIAPYASALDKWGPFRGRFVDASTGKGIPGVAVIAIWWKNEPNPVQMNRSFFDAVEAVSDEDGRFEIPRYPKPPFFDFLIVPAEISYFAPGYIPKGEEVTPADGQPFVAPTIVLMDAVEPRSASLLRTDARPGGVPLSKMKEFTKAINVERRMRGLPPLPIPE